jgi:hypothetical protein
MRYILVMWLAAFLVLSGTAAPAYAQDSGEGTIIGQVVNGTEGGGSVAGIEIMLLYYFNDTLVGTTAARTDDEGNFQYDGVSLENQYIVTANYMDVDYYYPVEFESGAATARVQVNVCDATENDDLIRVGITHKIVTLEAENLQITEFLWLVNDGDMTYFRRNGVLVFTLPEGAFGFIAPQELMVDFQLLGNYMVTYLVPFPPGERQLVFTYKLAKPDSRKFEIPLAIDYPTDTVEIMVGGEDIEVSVSQLAPAEPIVTDDGQRFMHFHGENFSRNTVINLSISDLSGGSGFPFYIFWIIIPVAVAGTVVFVVVRKRLGSGNEQ